MSIAVGGRLPKMTLKVIFTDKPVDMTTDELFKGKTVALFAVPGAYTPTCHLKHLPGFLALADALVATGADTIACVSVNDKYVMGQWAKDTGAHGRIAMVADWNAAFTKALGMEADLSAGTLGTRSKRYAMLVVDGVVKALNIEPSPGDASVSSAENLLKDM